MLRRFWLLSMLLCAGLLMSCGDDDDAQSVVDAAAPDASAPDARTPDAAVAVDANRADADIQALCSGPPDLGFEPNDTPAAAIQLPAQYYVVSEVGICAQDDADLYWVFVGNLAHLQLRVDFQHSVGDLTLELLDSAASSLRFSDSSTTAANFESIDLPNAPVGKYYIKVKGKSPSVRNVYALTLDLD